MHNRNLWLAILIMASSSFFESGVRAEEIEIDEIIVTTDRTDASREPVRVINNGDRAAPFLAADLLRGMPGVAISRSGNRGALTQIRLRGAEANHVLVLIDGVQADDPAVGSGFDFGTLTRAGIRKITLLNGPQSGLRGIDILAGIIHIDTTPSTDNTSVQIGLGTERSIDTSVDIARVNPLGHLGITASRSASEGTNASLTGNENDPFDSRLININGKRTIGNFSFGVTTRANLSEVDFDPTPFPTFVPIDGNRRSENRNVLIGISGQWRGSESWTPTIHLSSSRFNGTQIADSIDIETSLGTRRTVAFSNQFHVGSQQLNLTARHQIETMSRRDASSAFGNPDVDQTTQSSSIAAQYLYRWKKLSTSCALRYDHNSVFKNAATFALSASLVNGSTTWFTRVASGVKNPTFVERFGYTPDTFIGNSDLKPESSVEFQIGAAYSRRLLDLSAVYFKANLSSEIDGFVYDPINMGFTARNVASRSQRSGVEVTIQIRRRSHWLVSSYSLINSVESGHREVRRPRTLGRINYTFQVSKRWGLVAGLTHTGSQIDTDFSTYPGTRRRLEPYRLLNMGAMYEARPHLHLQVFVENLFNTKSQDVFGYRNPGTSIQGGIRASL